MVGGFVRQGTRLLPFSIHNNAELSRSASPLFFQPNIGMTCCFSLCLRGHDSRAHASQEPLWPRVAFQS